MKQKNLNVLITGASRGMGFAIAKKIAPRCNNLFLTSKSKDSCASICNKVKSSAANVYYNNFDHSYPKQSADNILKWISQYTNKLDAIILNAGIFIEGSLAEISSDNFQYNMDVNLIVNHFIVQKLLPFLKGQQTPRIVMIGSTAAYGGYSIPTYSVAKWALRSYAINLREELKNEGIGVTFIAPGGTLTDMWEGEDIHEGRLLEPNDIACVIDMMFELSNQAVIDEIIIKPILGDIDG